MKIKRSDIHKVRKTLQEAQHNRCAICNGSLIELTYNHTKKRSEIKYPSCLDHNHTTGAVRAVLCKYCNSLEGQIKKVATRYHRHINKEISLSKFLRELAQYIEHHEVNRTGLTHPDFLTEEEKRVQRNKKARRAYAATKGR